jgi:hypothetical protein
MRTPTPILDSPGRGDRSCPESPNHPSPIPVAPNGAFFEWQAGYAAFSVSESQVDRVRDYIHHQSEHHRAMPFKDEYLGLLRKHSIEFDEGYVFDEEITE